MDKSNLEKTKRTISIVAGFSRNTKQTTNEKLNLIPVDVQKADKCAKIAKTDEGKGFNGHRNCHFRAENEENGHFCTKMVHFRRKMTFS